MNTTIAPTTISDTDYLLAAVAAADHKRRVNAVNEFMGYRLFLNGELLNLKTGDVYSQTGSSGCNCPDFTTRIAKLRSRMTAAGVAAPCCCKHYSIRRLLSGHTVTVGASTFRARKK